MIERHRFRQIGAFVAALGLILTAVSAGVGPAPVGTAEAAPIFPTCGVWSFVSGVPCPSSSVTDHVAEVQVSGNATTDDSIVTVMSSVGRPEQGGENYAELKSATVPVAGSATVRADSQNPVLTVRLKQQNGQVITSKTLKEIGANISIGGLTVTFADLYKKSSTKTVDGTDDTQTALDIYSAAQAAAQSWNEFNTVASNYLSDTRTVAFARAQAAAKEAINQNATQSEVEQAAVEAVEDYYAQREINYLKAWETKAITYRELALRAQNESGVSGTLVYFDAVGDPNQPVTDIQVSYSVPLVNGSSLSIQAVVFEDGQSGYYNVFVPTGRAYTDAPTSGSLNYGLPSNDGDIEVASVDGNPSQNLLSVGVGYNDSTSSKIPTRTVEYLNTLEDATTQVSDNAVKWVNSTYDGFTNGSLNASTALNPTTLAQEYAQKYDRSGYYAYSAASLASIGYSTPNLSRTSSMTISVNGTTYEGLLLSQNNPPNGTWVAGETYDPSLVSGQQLFASAQNGTFALDQPFTIGEIRQKGGGTLDSTQAQTYSYQSVNNTEYQQLQKQLTALREELESREPAGGGGGFLGGGTQGTLLLILAGAGLYLYGRQEGSGGGR